MKKRFIMAGVFALCFLLSMFVTSLLINKDSRDMTMEMGSASLPVIYILEGNEYVNLHQGYVSEMSGNYLRDSLSPLSEGRILPIRIETYGTAISEIGYEVRSMDTKRLVEDQVLTDYKGDGTKIYADIAIKDLITPETEYMLIMKLTLSDNSLVKYYIRFIDKEELNVSEKLAFARSFSDSTFDKEKALELKTYMESNSEGDNSSFGYVNIHSSFEQLTWGGLNPSLEGSKRLYILDMDRVNASLKLEYQVRVLEELYNVREYFRIREGSDRMYLMEYERTMDQLITHEDEILVNGKLIHGIVSAPVKHMENDDGSVYSFVQQNCLYSYNTLNGNLARVFSFRAEENNDERTEADHYAIEPVSIDEQGNLTFFVYGYMSRGRHEGTEGIAVYYYDSVLNSVEEQLFIPYSRSYEILRHNMEMLSYINYRGNFFLYLDGTVYKVNLDTAGSTDIAAGLDEGRFVANDEGGMMAWQPENNIYAYNTLRLMDLEGERITDINAAGSEILLPLGFMGEDFIYGRVMPSDISTDESGNILAPMYSICIVDPRGNVLREHTREGCFFMGIEINGNIINIHRSIRDEDGNFIPIEDEQILTNEKSTASVNTYTSVATEEMETTWQTVLKNGSDDKNIKVLTPKEAVYEGERDVELESGGEERKFYVYSRGRVESVHTDESDAVSKASDIFGNVVDSRCAYVYESGNRKGSTTLSGFSEIVEHDENAGSLSVCLDAMMRYAGVYEDMENVQAKGGTAFMFLSGALTEKEVLNLTGIAPSSMLYYVSRGFPVLAFTEDLNAVLVVGYDSKNMVIYDPSQEAVYKKGMNDSTAWFEQNGNRFITYVD
ncbi:MAG: hypothetical protein K5770_05585 [Lachnospiraceae bacterium]|nr:hypothetical protein [Lachnospiraceae bacterium]